MFQIKVVNLDENSILCHVSIFYSIDHSWENFQAK